MIPKVTYKTLVCLHKALLMQRGIGHLKIGHPKWAVAFFRFKPITVISGVFFLQLGFPGGIAIPFKESGKC